MNVAAPRRIEDIGELILPFSGALLSCHEPLPQSNLGRTRLSRPQSSRVVGRLAAFTVGLLAAITRRNDLDAAEVNRVRPRRWRTAVCDPLGFAKRVASRSRSVNASTWSVVHRHCPST